MDGWASAGPVVGAELSGDVRGVLERLNGGWLGHSPFRLGDDLSHGVAVAAVDAAWRALDPIIERTADDHDALVSLVRQLHDVDRRLLALQLERSVESIRTLTRVLPRLESATCSVPELVALAPELICELGFDRGLISRVAGNVWYPELMYVMGDPEWAAVITEAGRADPLELVPGLHETEIVRSRTAILVTEAQSRRDGTWGHPGMVQASQTQSYVAAPIMSNAAVVGILHADRHGQRRHVDEFDRDLLAAFAEAFRLVLSRAFISDTLHSAQQLLHHVSTSLEEAYAAVHDMPTVRIDRNPGEATEGLVVRFGSRRPDDRRLPDTLTPREIEVLRLMASGRTNSAIARQLAIAEGTVKQHVKHVLHKLAVGNRSEAVARWFQAGGPVT